MIKRPMLAATVTYDGLEKVEWPVWCSPKVDGIRNLMHPELGAVTRSFKPLPNEYVREELHRWAAHTNLDGELVAVDALGKDLSYNETQSAMMSHSGQPAWKFMVFDCFERPDWDFVTRHQLARQRCRQLGCTRIKILKHEIIRDIEEFIKYTDKCIGAGFEGSIIRAPAGIYKSGRSTLRQGWLLKYKQWIDTEGIITGFVELMHNENPDVRDNFDLAKRSSAKDGMVPMGTLGALELTTEWGRLYVGSGFDQALRQEIWTRNMDVAEMIRSGSSGPPDVGRYVVFKYTPHGMKDKPRFPIFKGFRDDE